MEEEWKDIQEFPNYKISNLGSVFNKQKNHYVATPLMNKGYPCVRLWKNNTTKMLLIHRLIAIYFIPNPENKREVNHVDGNKKNNSLNNLEWVTPSENMKHAFKSGLSKGNFKKGFEHQRSKVTPEKVVLMFETRKQGAKLQEIADKFDLNFQHISRILKGRFYGIFAK